MPYGLQHSMHKDTDWIVQQSSNVKWLKSSKPFILAQVESS